MIEFIINYFEMIVLMKNIFKKFYFLPVMIFVVSIVACKKTNDDPKIKIEGFQLFDQLGNTLQRIGPPDNDWQLLNWTALSSFEQSLLNSVPDFNMDNTNPSTVFLAPYPNPVINISSVYLSSVDSANFKLIVTNETGTVLQHFSTKIKGGSVFQMNLSDRNVFPLKKSLRYYYSFSAANNVNFKVGYGDIKICDYIPGQTPLEDCFK